MKRGEEAKGGEEQGKDTSAISYGVLDWNAFVKCKHIRVHISFVNFEPFVLNMSTSELHEIRDKYSLSF